MKFKQGLRYAGMYNVKKVQTGGVLSSFLTKIGMDR